MTNQTSYGKHYPRFKTVPTVIKHDRNGKKLYFQALDITFIKQIGADVVNSLDAEGRAVFRDGDNKVVETA